MRPIGNLNVLSPALTLSRQEFDRIVAILRDAIEATMAELDRDGFDFAARVGTWLFIARVHKLLAVPAAVIVAGTLIAITTDFEALSIFS